MRLRTAPDATDYTDCAFPQYDSGAHLAQDWSEAMSRPWQTNFKYMILLDFPVFLTTRGGVCTVT
ncbi:MAG: hypothetical protein O2898_05805, partial [Proteobacteria bacterium]|nr:hypothetical protein [Pseudomonadota bacterium]